MFGEIKIPTEDVQATKDGNTSPCEANGRTVGQVAVITVSDRAAGGIYEDRSGPQAVSQWGAYGWVARLAAVVPDDLTQIQSAILEALHDGARIIMTTGGTGISPRDVTPQATAQLADYEVPGLAEQIRQQGLAQVKAAALSRGIVAVVSRAGQRAIVVNAAGSVGAVCDTVRVVAPLATHLIAQLDGGDHPL